MPEALATGCARTILQSQEQITSFQAGSRVRREGATDMQSAARRLKQLHEIAGGIPQQDLRSAGAGYDVVAELHAGGAQARDLGRKILDDEMNSVPSAGSGPLAVRHRPPGRAGRAAQQQPQRSPRDVGKRRRRAGEEREAEMLGV